MVLVVVVANFFGIKICSTFLAHPHTTEHMCYTLTPLIIALDHHSPCSLHTPSLTPHIHTPHTLTPHTHTPHTHLEQTSIRVCTHPPLELDTIEEEFHPVKLCSVSSMDEAVLEEMVQEVMQEAQGAADLAESKDIVLSADEDIVEG